MHIYSMEKEEESKITKSKVVVQVVEGTKLYCHHLIHHHISDQISQFRGENGTPNSSSHSEISLVQFCSKGSCWAESMVFSNNVLLVAML